MPWDNYKAYHIPYQDIKKNITCVQVVDYGNNNNIVQRYNIGQPDFAVGETLFDGEIIIYAQDDRALHDILREIFDTPVAVNDIFLGY